MPPVRCSNCGRFANAVVGCQNPRCVNINPVYYPVKSPSRCSNCGRFMNAVAGCQNPRCLTLGSLSHQSSASCSKSTVESFDKKPDQQLGTNAKGVSKVEFDVTKRFIELSTMYNELNKKLSPIMVDRKQLVVETDKLKNEQVEFRRMQKRLDGKYADICAAEDKNAVSINKFIKKQTSLNQNFTDKLAALENLEVKIDECFSKVDQLSTTNTKAVATLRSFANEKYHEMNTSYIELKKSLAQISSSHKELAAEHGKFINEQVKLRNTQTNMNEDFIVELAALEDRLNELDLFIAHKLDELAIESDAAAGFHTFAYEKFYQLDTVCSDQQTSLDQITTDHQKLAESNIMLLNDQAELRRKLEKLENEQEFTCSEMRRMLAQSAEDRKKLDAEIAELRNEQAELQRKLAKVDNMYCVIGIIALVSTSSALLYFVSSFHN